MNLPIACPETVIREKYERVAGALMAMHQRQELPEKLRQSAEEAAAAVIKVVMQLRVMEAMAKGVDNAYRRDGR